MKCLTDQMCIVEAEQFIATIIREKFDYTKWQREYFDAITPEEINLCGKLILLVFRTSFASLISGE